MDLDEQMAQANQISTETLLTNQVSPTNSHIRADEAQRRTPEYASRKFRYHFALKQNPVDVTATLFYNDITKSTWVFVRPV
jgi:hypothetical protein